MKILKAFVEAKKLKGNIYGGNGNFLRLSLFIAVDRVGKL